MSRLEKKLEELGYEYCAKEVIYYPKKVVVKTFSKEVFKDCFNYIKISNNKIIECLSNDKFIESKDLEILKGCEENVD